MYIPNIDGLWTAEFGSTTGIFGGGVAVFRDGEVLGGDSTYYYIGKYTLNGNALEAVLKISPFIQGAQSVFGTVGQEFVLKLTGSLSDPNHVLAQGAADGMPGLTFGAKLTRRR